MIICICHHCGYKGSVKTGDPATAKCPLYCEYCNTPEKRQKIHEANLLLGITKCATCGPIKTNV